MLSDIHYDDVVSGFYRAASGSIGWVEALTAFQRALSAKAVILFGLDASKGRLAFNHEATDFPAEASLDYLRTYNTIDSNAHLVMAEAPGKWMHCWEHFDEDFVAKDPFYQQFLIPYGGRYVSGYKVSQEGPLSVMLGVHRGHGSTPFDSAEKQLCARLARHLTDALALNRAHANERIQGRLGMELLKRLRTPVALVDARRQLRYANPRAQAMLAKGGAVRGDGKRVYFSRPQDDNALTAGLRQLLSDDEARLGNSPADKVFLKAHATTSGSKLGVYMYALRPDETLHAFGDEGLAMLLFHEPDQPLQLDPFVLAAAFELTPAETRVAVALAQGTPLEHVAQQLAVSINTVRSQLQTIFGKTGVTRQAELVSLIAGLPMAALGLRP